MTSSPLKTEALTEDAATDASVVLVPAERPWNQDQERESTRGDLARGLLWLLAFAIGGVIFFVGTKTIDGAVLAQSIFPSLIALAGTALGFYFGSQAVKSNGARE